LIAAWSHFARVTAFVALAINPPTDERIMPMTVADAHPAETMRLAHYPVTFFAIGMGMMGLTLAVRAGEHAFAMTSAASTWVLALSVAMLVAVAIGYAAKALTHFVEVKAEWNHPVRIAFFPAISISLLLLAAALFDPMPQLAHFVWLAGVVLQGVLALSVISAWIGHRPFQQGQLTPAWFIPAVGNVIVPLAGARLGYSEVSWLFFSGGLIFWLVLLTLVINRLMFHDPLPGRMVPTLMILIAPPAVAFTAWLRLTGEVGHFGHILLSVAYVFALLVATQSPKFRTMPFALSWWALSFPLAALTIASFGYAQAVGSAAHRLIGAGLLVLLLVVVAGLILRTALAIRAGMICRPE
jgi:tellurite resistance protein